CNEFISLQLLLPTSLTRASEAIAKFEPCVGDGDVLTMRLHMKKTDVVKVRYVKSMWVQPVFGGLILSPDRSLSFPSSELLLNCDLFPKQFSIVLTLKFSHTAPKRETKRMRRKKHGSRILLGLKFSRKRLDLVFRGHGEVVEHWVFRGARLADNQWHTLVLVVGSHPHVFFPPFSLRACLSAGLLRQLVLVPGSDATHHICPSSDPQLAALSVPPLLLDLHVPGREGGRHWHVGFYSQTEERVAVGLERSCSELRRGQLWFNPLRKGLYLCDGAAWVTVLEDHKRLDYILEHQVLATSSETHDVEVFEVPSVGLMAAMAHRSTASGSAVYLWTSSGFQLHQNISTSGALAWKHFTVGKKLFLVGSNSGGDPDGQMSKKSEVDFSVVYKWSKRRKRFVQFQTLQTHCARDWEAFSINQETYLAVANHRKGNNNHTINSVIYKWDRLTKSFQAHQTLLTSGAYDWEFFTVGPYHFLVVANAFDGVTTSVDSVIYVWVNGSFQVFQTIKTFCATDWEMFQIGNRVFLVVANGHRLYSSGPSQYTINSTIYELDMTGRLFVRFQDIVTHSAVDWEFFSLGEEYFLVVANSFNGESYSLNSILYRWQGYEGFVPVHWLPTIGCSDWEFFSFKGESYLIYSSAKAPLSKVFRLKTY
uniref:Thrombospondin-type laminin G domain and EAR repeats a n=1 Tax=Salarias fasciatus TaxID=181472 RepID=A0A672HUZ5_SALFA